MKKFYNKFWLLVFPVIFVFTFAACETESASPGGAVGQGGSMARFTISGNHLYTVGTSSMQIFDITDVQNPVKGEYIPVGFNIETIFADDSSLFIGSQTGMHIYDISKPAQPAKLSMYDHITSCDPVVASGNYAYVTLRSGVDCRVGQNLLDVIDISDRKNPKLITSRPMSNPHGLAIADTLLYVCEGNAGLKIINVKDPSNIRLVNHVEGFHAFDVIHENNKTIITGKDGILQYDVTNPLEVELLSQILIQND